MPASNAAGTRRHPRVELRAPLRLSTLDAERDARSGRPCFRSSAETCVNLSRGGALVRTRDPLAPGRRVLLEIELPDGWAFEAVGRVAWTRPEADARPEEPYGVGIEFLGGATSQWTRLESFLGPRLASALPEEREE